MGEEIIADAYPSVVGTAAQLMHSLIASDIGMPVRVGSCIDLLGESPIWNTEEQALYWVDIRGQALRRLNYATFAVMSWPLPDMPSGVVLGDGSDLIVVLRSTVVRFDPRSGAMEEITAPLVDAGDKRFNESKLDRAGHLWSGRMDDTTRDLTGGLYRLDADGFVEMVGSVAVPNSLAWSLDGSIMYFADGVEPVIWEFDYDQSNGTLGERRCFAMISDGSGIPDGATVDADGFVWSAHYGGGKVTRYHPSGAVHEAFDLPLAQPTNCALGGPELDVLFITSASQDLWVQRGSLDGALLAMRVDAVGVSEPRFDSERSRSR